MNRCAAGGLGIDQYRGISLLQNGLLHRNISPLVQTSDTVFNTLWTQPSAAARSRPDNKRHGRIMSFVKRSRGMPAGLRHITLGALLAVGACTSLAPPQTRPTTPAVPLPDGYPDAANAAPSRTAAELDWRQYITDPALRTLIDQALQHNADLRTATLRVQELRAAYGLQRAERLPTVGVVLDAARARVPGDLNITGQPIISSQYQVAIAESAWELDFWGRVRSLEDAALQNYLATDAGRRAATLGLINQVAQADLQLRELDAARWPTGPNRCASFDAVSKKAPPRGLS